MNTFFGRSWDDWIAEYAESHQHPKNRLCHSFGIPMIAISIPLMLAGIFWSLALWVGLALFVVGWVLQFIGHAYEKKPPEFSETGGFYLWACVGGLPKSKVKPSPR